MQKSAWRAFLTPPNTPIPPSFDTQVLLKHPWRRFMTVVAIISQMPPTPTSSKLLSQLMLSLARILATLAPPAAATSSLPTLHPPTPAPFTPSSLELLSQLALSLARLLARCKGVRVALLQLRQRCLDLADQERVAVRPE